MIDFINVNKSYGEQDLLIDSSFRINKNEKVGIVGPNGAGKSTIFNIITEDITPDTGNIMKPKDIRIGYLQQHLIADKKNTSLIDFTSNAIPELIDITKEIEEIETKIANNANTEKDINKLGQLQTKFETLGGYTLLTDAEKALSGLGFAISSFQKPLASFSGGWQMRAALAQVLISNPDILLLDEPSNYLDVLAIEWLYKFLKGYQGTLLLISHDRFLLKRLTNITYEVNGGEVIRYAGDYDYYVKIREERRITIEAAQKNQGKKRDQMEQFIERFRSKNTKASLVKSQIKKLEKMDKIKSVQSLNYSGMIKIPEPPSCGSHALSLENLGFTYNNNDWIFKNVDIEIESGAKVGVVGYNGMGKTTLLKVIAGVMKESEGKRVLGHNIVQGYQAQEFGDIFLPEQRVSDIVRKVAPASTTDQQIRNIVGSFGFSGEAMDKQCKVLSGGEKIRLAFARIFVNPPNLLILDEPTTHLDIAAREHLQNALREYKGTVCLVSHDIEFLRASADTIISVHNCEVKKYDGGFDYYYEQMKDKLSMEEEVVNEEEDCGLSKKELRQEKAAQRKKMQKDKKRLETAINKLESELEKLEIKKDQINEELISNPNADFATGQRELSLISEKIDSNTEEWENYAMEYEEFLEEWQKI